MIILAGLGIDKGELMEGRINYTAVGVFVIGLVMAGLAIFFWLELRKHDQTYDTYIVYLHEDVSGLSVDSAVRYNGVPVGFVKSIGLVPSNSQLVKVVVSIESETPINISTVGTLMSQGITGVDYLGLSSEQVDAPPLLKHSGEDYPVIPSRPSLLVQLSKVLPQLATNISQLSDSIGAVFDEKNRESIALTLKNIQLFTKTLNQNSDAILTDMQTMLKQTHDTMKLADDTLISGRVTMNAVAQQILPPTQQALQRLNTIEINLQALTDALRRDPSIIVRGNARVALGPGEKR